MGWQERLPEHKCLGGRSLMGGGHGKLTSRGGRVSEACAIPTNTIAGRVCTATCIHVHVQGMSMFL